MSEYPWGQVSVDSQDNGLISICWDVSRSCKALAKRWTASYSRDVSVCETAAHMHCIQYFTQCDSLAYFREYWTQGKKKYLSVQKLFRSCNINPNLLLCNTVFRYWYLLKYTTVLLYVCSIYSMYTCIEHYPRKW